MARLRETRRTKPSAPLRRSLPSSQTGIVPGSVRDRLHVEMHREMKRVVRPLILVAFIGAPNVAAEIAAGHGARDNPCCWVEVRIGSRRTDFRVRRADEYGSRFASWKRERADADAEAGRQ